MHRIILCMKKINYFVRKVYLTKKVIFLSSHSVKKSLVKEKEYKGWGVDNLPLKRPFVFFRCIVFWNTGC